MHKLLKNMTQGEQWSLRTQTFDSLWVKLWGNGVEHHLSEYNHAKQMFDSIDLSKLLDEQASE